MKNRVLIVGASHSGKLRIINDLFGSLPSSIPECHAGIIHQVELSTKYYRTDLVLWIDEFGEKGDTEESLVDSFKKWVETFSSEEAKEAREVIGGIIFTFNESGRDKVEVYLQLLEELLQQFNKDEVEGEGGSGDKLVQWDGVCLAVMVPDGGGEDVDVEGFESAVEVVRYGDVGWNQFGERLGVGRALEALEAVAWD